MQGQSHRHEPYTTPIHCRWWRKGAVARGGEASERRACDSHPRAARTAWKQSTSSKQTDDAGSDWRRNASFIRDRSPATLSSNRSAAFADDNSTKADGNRNTNKTNDVQTCVSRWGKFQIEDFAVAPNVGEAARLVGRRPAVPPRWATLANAIPYSGAQSRPLVLGSFDLAHGTTLLDWLHVPVRVDAAESRVGRSNYCKLLCARHMFRLGVAYM